MAQLKGKRVLVVGGGNSACDMYVMIFDILSTYFELSCLIYRLSITKSGGSVPLWRNLSCEPSPGLLVPPSFDYGHTNRYII